MLEVLLRRAADYIIVGGGSAGCVLANRLSANPDVEVILLEAGPDDGNLFFQMPAGYFQLMKSAMCNWKYETVPQAGLNGRTMYAPRGKVLGGSSMVNAMVFIRGNAGDFDSWAESGAQGWSYQDCLPYFRRLETFEGPPSQYRGASGPIKVTAGLSLDMMSPIPRAWIEAGVAAGYPYNPDANGVGQSGFGPASGNFGGGKRQSASVAYLDPVRARSNLAILTGAHATRLISKGRRAVGVDVVIRGRVEKLYAGSEVIVAAGAFNSPQLLQLSGIGDPALLREYSIGVVCEAPEVGENLQDHLAVSVQQRVVEPVSALRYLHPWRAVPALLQYLLFGTGPAASNGLEAMAFVKSRPDLQYPDLQYHLPLIMYEDHGRKVIPEEGFQVHATSCRPKSVGSVRIRSADPSHGPAIDPQYLDDLADLEPLRAAIRVGREIVAQAPFDKLRGKEYAPGIDVASNADLDEYIRRTAMSVYHPVGTCRMGSDERSVVDPELKVRGMEGLRVVDASVMPHLITGNTNAATMMIAERAADLLLAV